MSLWEDEFLRGWVFELVIFRVDEPLSGWTFGWMSFRVGELSSGWIFEWMSFGIDEFSSGWVFEWMSFWVNKLWNWWVLEWMSLWVDEFWSEWALEWMSLWVDELLSWWFFEWMSWRVDVFGSYWGLCFYKPLSWLVLHSARFVETLKVKATSLYNTRARERWARSLHLSSSVAPSLPYPPRHFTLSPTPFHLIPKAIFSPFHLFTFKCPFTFSPFHPSTFSPFPHFTFKCPFTLSPFHPFTFKYPFPPRRFPHSRPLFLDCNCCKQGMMGINCNKGGGFVQPSFPSLTTANILVLRILAPH